LKAGALQESDAALELQAALLVDANLLFQLLDPAADQPGIETQDADDQKAEASHPSGSLRFALAARKSTVIGFKISRARNAPRIERGPCHREAVA
jgi:hypothetical protein